MEYACEVWDGCSLEDSENLEKLQLEAGRIVTGLPIFASRDAIYSETGWELLSHRRKTRRLSLFYSIHNNTAPGYLCTLKPPLVNQISNYNLRNNNNYTVPFCRLSNTKKSFFYATINDWNHLSPVIRNSGSIGIFKSKIKSCLYKPPSYFSCGDRKTNIIHTRLRNMCSQLNADLHRVNLIGNPSCICGHPYEDCIHYFLECNQYVHDRMTLFNELNEFNVSIELILAGDESLTNEENTYVFLCVYSFIRRTKRFE